MTIEGRTYGLALSGGGYRATLFGLGTLWRLNDAGILGKLDRITSVSGGSIVSGILAHRWHKLTFVDGKAMNFEEQIVKPVQTFCEETIDIGAGLKGLITPFKSAGDFLRDKYAKRLFGTTKMSQIPDASLDGNPKFIIYATNLQTGRSFRFRQDMLADYMLGVCSNTDVTLAFAVAASSAFPPIFSPIELETDRASWSRGTAIKDIDRLRKNISLADGGVYDNMGLESLVDNVDIVLVSDAGAPLDIDQDPKEDYLGQLSRVRDILIDQTRALRKRWLISEFEAQRKRGAYWGIGTRIEDYSDAEFPFKDTSVTDGLASVPTRLAKFEDNVRDRLVNWGYVLCDVALRKRAMLAITPATALPIPKWSLS